MDDYYSNYEKIWICIKKYNGYEISTDGIVRSMKNYMKYPTGIFIKRYKDSKGYYYFLTNNSNEREKVYVEDLLELVNNDPNPIRRQFYDTDISSRNKIINKSKKKKIDNKEFIGIPRFTIIDEEQKKVVPFHFF